MGASSPFSVIGRPRRSPSTWSRRPAGRARSGSAFCWTSSCAGSRRDRRPGPSHRRPRDESDRRAFARRHRPILYPRGASRGPYLAYRWRQPRTDSSPARATAPVPRPSHARGLEIRSAHGRRSGRRLFTVRIASESCHHGALRLTEETYHVWTFRPGAEANRGPPVARPSSGLHGPKVDRTSGPARVPLHNTAPGLLAPRMARMAPRSLCGPGCGDPR